MQVASTFVPRIQFLTPTILLERLKRSANLKNVYFKHTQYALFTKKFNL